MRVLNRLAHLDEEIEPCAGVELLGVTILQDADAADVLHDEVRPAGFRRAGVEHLGDVGMIHHRQGLSLGLEAGDHLLRVHAQLDDL